jgi:hypothetical protein
MGGAMHRRNVVLSAACCSIALGCAAGAQSRIDTAQPAHSWPPLRTLKNEHVGYSLSYPRGWKVAAQVVATQFATGAKCQSVRVVDLPAKTNPTAVRQSFVQICWRRDGGRSLAAFMRATYGRKLANLFARTRLGGVPAYRTRDGKRSRTFFLQANGYRLQLVATVSTTPTRRAKRLAQVNRILASLAVTH